MKVRGPPDRHQRLHPDREVWADLASRGEMIGAHDLLIAATALTYEHAVVTGSAREFDRVEGLEVMVWPRPG